MLSLLDLRSARISFKSGDDGHSFILMESLPRGGLLLVFHCTLAIYTCDVLVAKSLLMSFVREICPAIAIFFAGQRAPVDVNKI